MSEDGEIPANEMEPSRNGDDGNSDDKHEEVLAAAVIDENDEDGSEGSNDVVMAKVVEDEPATATAVAETSMETEAVPPPATDQVTTTDASEKAKGAPADPAEKEEEEEGEVVETPDESKTSSGKEKNALTVTSAPSADKEKEAKDSQESAKEPTVEAVKEEEVPSKLTAKEDVKDPDVPPKEEQSKESQSDTIMAAATDTKDKEPKQVVPPAPPKKEEDEAEEGEVEEGEVEEGEIEDTPPGDAAKATTNPTGIAGEKPTEPKKENATEGEIEAMGSGAETKEGDNAKSPENKDTKSPEEKEEPSDAKRKEESVEDEEMKPAATPTNNVSPTEGATDKTAEEPKETTAKDADDTKPPEEKPKLMEVDESKAKVSESSPEVKKNEEEEEDGEIKEDVEEGELKEDTDEESDVKEETEEEGEIKEDVDMEDAMSQSEEGGDRDVGMAAADADTASVDGYSSSMMDESVTKKAEPSYSTRGRASGTTTPVPRDSAAKTQSGTSASAASSGSAQNDQWQRSVREALEDLGRGGSKEGTPAGVGPGGASFLEALGEEERRTRTRFLPAVDGIHMLRKNEIKGDLALARSIMSSAGTVANVASVAAGASASSSVSKKSKSKKKQDSSSGEADAMDVDNGDVMSSSEEDPTMDGGRIGSASTIQVEGGDILVVPSSAFVPPPAATHSSSTPTAANGEQKEDGAPSGPVSSTGVKGILNNQRNVKSPKVVESVTAFNPPRPPESVGKKKQHRMLRWERRPADVELDLNSYRKTVDRTRKELHTEEAELERVEATSNHLRRHFLGHLRCMDQEMEQIMGVLNSVQQNCVNTADLLTSRTRSRGAGKGSYVMRDVLTVLKARGAELDEKGLSLKDDFLATSDIPRNYPGLGGVGGSSFADWNQRSTFPPSEIASAWVLPGDKVDTPYGEGRVSDISDGSISVRLPFGIGHFNPASVVSKEYPNTLTDARLAKRWRGMIDSAVSHSGRLDLNGMASVDSVKQNLADQSDKAQHGSNTEAASSTANGGAAPKNVDCKDTGNLERNDGGSISCDETKLLPFGSSLLPTGTGRGSKLCEVTAVQLQKNFKPVLTDGTGVLGDQANEGVPFEVKDFEENRQESYILQAKVLQLRNELYRQRRIRTLNERTFAATRDRSTRVESLVAEMRTDLKSLKYRLDEELKELGIDQDRAEAILKSYYISQDYGEHGLDEDEQEMSITNKRPRDDDKHNNSDGHISEPQKNSRNGVADADIERQAKRPKVASQ